MILVGERSLQLIGDIPEEVKVIYIHDAQVRIQQALADLMQEANREILDWLVQYAEMSSLHQYQYLVMVWDPGILPCLLKLLGLFFIHESPRWLENADRENECQSALQRVHGKGTDKSQEVEEIKELTQMLNSLPRGSKMALFQERYLHAVIVGVGMMAVQQFGGINDVGFFASSVFVSAGLSSCKSWTTAVVVLSFPMTGLGALLADKSGRRPPLLVSAAGTCLDLVFVTISFLLQFSSHVSLKTSLAFFGRHSGIYGIFLIGIQLQWIKIVPSFTLVQGQNEEKGSCCIPK